MSYKGDYSLQSLTVVAENKNLCQKDVFPLYSITAYSLGNFYFQFRTIALGKIMNPSIFPISYLVYSWVDFVI